MLMMSSHSKSIKELLTKLEQKDTEIQDLKRGLSDLQSRVEELEQDGMHVQVKSKHPKIDKNPVSSSGLLYLGLYFNVNAFNSKRKLNNSAMFCFYLGKNSYRMELLVFPNGKGKSRDSYMSVYFRICHSSHDSQLVWPFHGSITISIGNVTATIQTKSYPDECFVQPPFWGEYNEKWGIENFISHSIVDKFLVKDSLLVKIVSVSLPIPVSVS